MAFKVLCSLAAPAYRFDHCVLPLFNLSFMFWQHKLLMILHTLLASLPLVLLFPLSGMPFPLCRPIPPLACP